ncbi:DAK2 domain-containing protein [Tindallia californiensis]|uniref:DhaL domain-containing protein n=1 Tax=Tindallia californiensis TaxID=159292 RepID=A0A1H3NVC5_9FIRM|nr:DAK2 domain-containing protein [Tindallia californiensis]SDY92405.1 hypothetical protein SAMN05192546_105293 [Tindallia californiensis]
MNTQTINGKNYKSMMISARQTLLDQQEIINSLNVFPVPDGDTGTNMTLTVEAAIKELNKSETENIDELAEAVANGSLMGARGNSGVILSQLFRGFAKSLKTKKEITVKDIAMAMKNASDTAYQAVMKPTEGTILTVARESADAAMMLAEKEENVETFLRLVILKANESLERTPDQLRVLKEAGVVDSGGKGLVAIMEGALKGIFGEKDLALDMNKDKQEKHPYLYEIDPEEIHFGYCTEFIINAKDADVAIFKSKITHHGDSMLVVANEKLMKVHIHTNHPGKVLEEALKIGDLTDIKIDNMRLQHQHKNFKPKGEKATTEDVSSKPYGMISVAMGEGLKSIMEDFCVDVIIEGGQTMNPSTEDFLNAIEKIDAEHIFIMPNNSNIIMAANQAKGISGKSITVIPTKTIPQGISAILAFNPDIKPTENESAMNQAIREVKTGQVTYAVRDTSFNGMTISKNEIIGLSDKEIRSAGKNLNEVSAKLIEKMIATQDEIMTIYYGEDTTLEEAKDLQKQMNLKYKDVEVEVYEGGQPLYYYIISLE